MRTEETDRATYVEIFFDLVFVFAFTRIILLMGNPLTPLNMAHGLLLLMLLWISWSNYTWLGNLARADVGVVRAGMLVGMAAIFVAALVIPDAWRHGAAELDAPLILALAYVALTALHLLLYGHVTVGNRRLRTTLRLFASATVFSWIPLILGARLGGTAQTCCGRRPSSSLSPAPSSPQASPLHCYPPRDTCPHWLRSAC
jgi:low temperature requirement protein LtrA